MIKIWKQNGNSLCRSAILERDCWLQVTAPTPLEKESLTREYGIEEETIKDILDIDERSRFEREDAEGRGYLLIIYRVPFCSGDAPVPYYTVPMGIILVDGLTITVCAEEPGFIRALQSKTPRDFHLDKPFSFVLQLIRSAAVTYLSFLKEINRKTGGVEQDLQKSIKNTELIRLLNMEKSLVYFTTSLKSNALVIDKMRKGVWNGLDNDAEDLLEDVITENLQAIEMANIYSNILSGMMDAFASVISNNLNTVMKRLTMISIALMIPTLFASLYGMNLVHLPFSGSPFAFIGIAGVSVVSAVLGSLFFLRTGRIK